MTNPITLTSVDERHILQVTWLVLLGAVVMFLILQFGLTFLVSSMDPTWSAFLSTMTMLLFVLAFERFVFARRSVEALSALGWVGAKPSAILVAVILIVPMLAFFPIVSLSWGVPMELRSDWFWILAGVIVLNGVGEETLFRGFIFGQLRRGGLSFVRAALIALLIFTAVHLLLFAQNPFAIALAGTVIALVASFPLAYLFERAGFSIWPTVILHVATHAIRLV